MTLRRIVRVFTVVWFSASVAAAPVKLYCLGVFADGSPLQTELSIDEDFGEVKFGQGKQNTLELRSSDAYKYEWASTDDGTNFVTILNRFSGELTSFRKVKDGDPQIHFQAMCYTQNDRKF